MACGMDEPCKYLSLIRIVADQSADGGGRTHTLLPVPDFESGASANSATSAMRRPKCRVKNISQMFYENPLKNWEVQL